MNNRIVVAVFAVAAVSIATAQAPSKAAAPSTVIVAQNSGTPSPSTTAPGKTTAQAPQTTTAPQGSLEAALNVLDKAAANFKDIQTDFVWDQYTKVVDEHDQQSGTMYFRRNGQNVEMFANITKPDNKQVLFADGRVRVYQPKIDQVTEYSAGKNKNDFESFLVLGFGGRGHDLQKSFDVKYDGMENVGGVNAYKLDLTPKSERVHNMFSLITLWIDKDRGVSVQQRFQERSGDYRLAKYSNIKINEKLNNDVFKLKTTGSTKVIRPNG